VPHNGPFHDPTNRNLAIEVRDMVGLPKPELPLNLSPKCNWHVLSNGMPSI